MRHTHFVWVYFFLFKTFQSLLFDLFLFSALFKVVNKLYIVETQSILLEIFEKALPPWIRSNSIHFKNDNNFWSWATKKNKFKHRNVVEMDEADSIKMWHKRKLSICHIMNWETVTAQHKMNTARKKNLKTRYKKQLNFCKQFHIKMVKMSYLIVVFFGCWAAYRWICWCYERPIRNCCLLDYHRKYSFVNTL